MGYSINVKDVRIFYQIVTNLELSRQQKTTKESDDNDNDRREHVKSITNIKVGYDTSSKLLCFNFSNVQLVQIILQSSRLVVEFVEFINKINR